MERFIIVLVVILAIIAIAQLLRVQELADAIKGNREEVIRKKDNELNANLMLVFMFAFYAFFIYLTAVYGVDRFGKGEANSDIGQETDWLLGINMYIITAVFFVTNSLLFGFAWKYYYREDRKAYWFPHSNKLELIWTVVPAMVLAVIIILGLKTWFNIMSLDGDSEADVKGEVVEVYAEQFGFTTRYAGEDNRLGQSDYKLVNGKNPLGVINTEQIAIALDKFDKDISDCEIQLEEEGAYLPDWKVEELESKIIRSNRLKRRLYALANDIKRDSEQDSTDWDAIANNDVMVKGEIFLVKGRKYHFRFRSKDVIHSAYFPHFRAQMNMVPGMTTYFSFTPITTTQEKRDEMNNQEFDYILVCNKICGTGHSGMKCKVIVGTEDEFRTWLAGKKTIGGATFPEKVEQWEDGMNLFPEAEIVEEPAEGEETASL